MPNYSKAIEEIKEKCNIVEVIGSVVPLKRNGPRHSGCCPFHKEKTPSFFVTEDKGFYHCFGCGEHGDVIKFVEKYYNLSFTDAIEKLAAQYHIEIEDSVGGYENNGKKEELYEANRIAARYFFNQLIKTNNPGVAYLGGRGMNAETIKNFGIGYADSDSTSLLNYMKRSGIKEETLIELGLCKSSYASGSKGCHDMFRDRVIFPIINTRDKVIGFGGRVLQKDLQPKYLNSQESLIYKKKDNLYGLNRSKSAIQKAGYAILVEGYMDCVSLYQYGVENVAASLGTALTPEQARLLKRYTKKIVLCYDSDGAGIKAALRGIEVLRGAELEVRVLNVDDGKDPDEYVKKHGKDAFLRLVDEKSLSDVDYRVKILRQRFDMRKTDQRLAFLKETANILRSLPPVEADIYIQRTAAENHISEPALRQEIEKPDSTQIRTAPRRGESSDSPQEDKRITAADIKLEQLGIRLIMNHSDYLEELSAYPEMFVTNEGMVLRQIFNSYYKPGTDFEMDRLRDVLDESEYNYLKQIMDTVITGDEKAAFSDLTDRLKDIQKKRKQKEINEALKLLDSLPENEVDQTQADNLLKEWQKLQRS